MVACRLHESDTESFFDQHITILGDESHTNTAHLMTVEMFCKFLNISSNNCSCESNPTVCEITSFVRHNDTEPKIFQRWHGVTVIYASIAVASSVCGMIGNGVVIFIAYKQRSKISPCKLHIAELAVVNFIFSIVQIMNVVPLYWTNTWVYGQAMCKLSKSLLEIGSLLSSVFFQLIAVERYILIVFALHINKIKNFEHQYKHHILGGNFLIVMISVIPYIDGVSIEPESQRCVTFSNQNKWSLPYNWFTFLAYSCLPICVTSILATKLFIHFAREASSSLLVRRDKVNRRIMLHMLLVLVLFIICTLPSRLVSISMDMVYFHSHDVMLGFQFLSYTLYSLQGTLNPFLYSMLAKEWRKNLSNMMRSMFGGNATLLEINPSITSRQTRVNSV